VIGSLAGTITLKEPPRLLVEVHGVGYEVEVPMSTYLGLPAVGAAVSLRIHHVLREDASLLFGFATESERELFRGLLKVNSVGPKVALAILSGMNAEAFRAAVAMEDVAGLTRIPGVGRKTAERLLVEMRDHFKGIAPGGTTVQPAPRTEALHALQALGYKPQEAQRMIDRIATDGASTEELIRAALKQERV
jgi:holliday junction DNA helicase RuvA